MVFWNLGQSRATGASSRESDVMSLVEYEQSAGIGRLILNRPEDGNAVNPALIADLGNAVEAACATPIRALLIVARGAHSTLGGWIGRASGREKSSLYVKIRVCRDTYKHKVTEVN